MFENIGTLEIFVIFLVILIFFGPKKIPELAASLGKGLRKFNDAKQGFETQIKTAMKEPLDAMTEATQGLEKKLADAAQPFNSTLGMKTPQPAQPTAPILTPPTESFARGSSLEAPPKEDNTPSPAEENPSEAPKREA